MAATGDTPRKLWEHPSPQSTRMGLFKSKIEKSKGVKFSNRSAFWGNVWEELPLIHEGNYTSIVDESAPIQTNPDWFSGVRINFAENILFSTPSYADAKAGVRSIAGKEDSKIAIHEVVESNFQPPKNYTWGELRQQVGLYTQALKAAGVRRGDRVAVVTGNNINCLLLFLATTALGALVSTTSSDTGTKGILDRLTQVEPILLFMDDAAVYKSQIVDLRDKMTEVVNGMHAISGFKGAVALPRLRGQPRDITSVPRTQPLKDFLSKAPSNKLEFVRVGFRDPFMIVYSSGTTGQPKCIVHSTGGVLINIVKEAILHRDMNTNSVMLQYTTTGWIMYLTSVASLLTGSKVILYDGSPFAPDASFLIRLAGEQRVTHFGISPRYLQELRKQKIQPRKIADLSNLYIVSSTGMVLADSLFEWFYDEGFPSHAHLGNISGGTDIAACFAMDNPLSPLYVGGCQGGGLGVPIAVYEQVDEGLEGVDGKALPDGESGELVATAAFPSTPVTFWGKDGPKKYFNAYYAKFNNIATDVWTHGDFITIHPVTKQVIFSGRSDGVLNPSGIRFGSAEIYNVLETQFASEVMESVCVGQRRPQDLDESVFLFVQMQPDREFTEALVQRIRDAIRKALSPRHVPKYIFETPEIPATITGKKVELPVKSIVSGKRIKPSGTLANPRSLDFYYQFAEVEKLGKSTSM
uniref:Acetoacetyl-CoA synthetase n=1 Tax=Talaromyces marneffei PM1 TaxID=1077442 RepID=A0A093VJ03_TALMA